MDMPNPKKDHPVIQDARKVLHLSQMLDLFSHGLVREEDAELFRDLISESASRLSRLSDQLDAKLFVPNRRSGKMISTLNSSPSRSENANE